MVKINQPENNGVIKYYVTELINKLFSYYELKYNQIINLKFRGKYTLNYFKKSRDEKNNNLDNSGLETTIKNEIDK